MGALMGRPARTVNPKLAETRGGTGALPGRAAHAMHSAPATRLRRRRGERKSVTRDKARGPHKPRGDAPRSAGPSAGGKPSGERSLGGKRTSDEQQGGQHGGGRPWQRDRRRDGGPSHRPARDANLIWGFHSVREALRGGRRNLVRLSATSAAAERLSAEIAASGVSLAVLAPDAIDAFLPVGAVHQGLVLEAGPLPDVGLDDLPADTLVLVLDQVTDPHNVGAIIRTAAAFGVRAIVTTERHSPALGGVLAKAASGGLEHVDVITVVNLARALETLGDMGFLRVGLDSEGPQSLTETPLTRPLALVLGAEGKGLRRLSRENCDVLARIDLPGAVRSLNVSNACAVALTIASLKLAAG